MPRFIVKVVCDPTKSWSGESNHVMCFCGETRTFYLERDDPNITPDPLTINEVAQYLSSFDDNEIVKKIELIPVK